MQDRRRRPLALLLVLALAVAAPLLILAPPAALLRGGPLERLTQQQRRQLQGSPPAPIPAAGAPPAPVPIAPPAPVPALPSPLQVLEATRSGVAPNALLAPPLAAAPDAAPVPVSTAVAVPNGAGGLGKVAVLIIGQLRGYFQSTEKTQQFLIDPLKRDFGQVDIFMCIDKPNGCDFLRVILLILDCRWAIFALILV